MGKWNKGHVYRDRIAAADAGVSLINFYSRRYAHSTEGEWRERIRVGRVRVNGAIAPPETRLRNGDLLEWRRPPWQEPDAPDAFEVITLEDSFLIVGKPSGLPVLPGAGFMENTLLWRVRDQFGAACIPVHRLGRWTSGAVLFARTGPAARYLGRAMQAQRFVKIYLALAAGTDIPNSFQVNIPIGPVAYSPLGTLHAASAQGRPAHSRVEVLCRFPERNSSLVQVTITTGRPHQIRIHLAAAGYPLTGDPLYGPGGRPRDLGALPGDKGYCLHAWKLGFPHPAVGRDVLAECPPPEWAKQAAADPRACPRREPT